MTQRKTMTLDKDLLDVMNTVATAKKDGPVDSTWIRAAVKRLRRKIITRGKPQKRASK